MVSYHLTVFFETVLGRTFRESFKKIIDNFNFFGISEDVTLAMRCQPRRLSRNYLSGSGGECGERSFYNILTLKMLMVAYRYIKQLNYSNKTETETNDAR